MSDSFYYWKIEGTGLDQLIQYYGFHCHHHHYFYYHIVGRLCVTDDVYVVVVVVDDSLSLLLG